MSDPRTGSARREPGGRGEGARPHKPITKRIAWGRAGSAPGRLARPAPTHAEYISRRQPNRAAAVMVEGSRRIALKFDERLLREPQTGRLRSAHGGGGVAPSWCPTPHPTPEIRRHAIEKPPPAKRAAVYIGFVSSAAASFLSRAATITSLISDGRTGSSMNWYPHALHLYRCSLRGLRICPYFMQCPEKHSGHIITLAQCYHRHRLRLTHKFRRLLLGLRAADYRLIPVAALCR